MAHDQARIREFAPQAAPDTVHSRPQEGRRSLRERRDDRERRRRTDTEVTEVARFHFIEAFPDIRETSTTSSWTGGQ